MASNWALNQNKAGIRVAHLSALADLSRGIEYVHVCLMMCSWLCMILATAVCVRGPCFGLHRGAVLES